MMKHVKIDKEFAAQFKEQRRLEMGRERKRLKALLYEQTKAFRTTRTVAPPGSDLAKLRIECHKAYDPLWEFDFMSRNEVYRRLAKAMRIPLDECHFGMFDIERCQRALALRNDPVITED